MKNNFQILSLFAVFLAQVSDTRANQQNLSQSQKLVAEEHSIQIEGQNKVGSEVSLLSNLFGSGRYTLTEGVGSLDNSLNINQTEFSPAKPLDYKLSKNSIRVSRKTDPSIVNFQAGPGHNLIVMNNGSLWGYGRMITFNWEMLLNPIKDIQFRLKKVMFTSYRRSVIMVLKIRRGIMENIR